MVAGELNIFSILLLCYFCFLTIALWLNSRDITSVSFNLPSKSLGKPLICIQFSSVQFSQSLSRVRLFATPWPEHVQGSLSITNSWSPTKPMSVQSVISSNHLILCSPLLLLPSIFPSIRVFYNESALHIRWPKYWSFSFSISPSSEHSGLISFRI